MFSFQPLLLVLSRRPRRVSSFGIKLILAGTAYSPAASIHVHREPCPTPGTPDKFIIPFRRIGGPAGVVAYFVLVVHGFILQLLRCYQSSRIFRLLHKMSLNSYRPKYFFLFSENHFPSTRIRYNCLDSNRTHLLAWKISHFKDLLLPGNRSNNTMSGLRFSAISI